MVSSKAIVKLRRSWWRPWQRNLSAHGASLGSGQTNLLDVLSPLDSHCLHCEIDIIECQFCSKRVACYCVRYSQRRHVHV